MSVRNSNTTADYLEWDTMLSLIRKLFRDKEYRMSLLIGAGCFFGLRISDLLRIKWSMILNTENLELIEHKTNKRRVIKVNKHFQKHIRDCYDALKISNLDEYCFISQKRTVYSIQRINVKLKEIKQKYNLPINHFSTHSFRKSMGRKIVEDSGINADFALIKLSEIFQHSSPAITKRYLGIKQEEILELYDKLDF